VPLEECFENLANRLPNEDNDMFVTGINILRETGGNLAETFDKIVAIIRERIRLQQKIDAYTANGTFQGITIFSMPFVLLLLYWMVDPQATTPLFTTTLGWLFLTAALMFNVAGAYFILKIVRIKV
jgi:tight adherence protein B